MNLHHIFDGTQFLADAAPELCLSEEPAVTEFSLLHISRQAMATHFEIMIPLGIAQAQFAADAALDMIDQLEDQLTVYRPHSEVSRLNDRAPMEDVHVDRRLFELFSFAAHLTRETQGAFDIATGAIIKAWGFYARAGRIPTVAERTEAMSRTGMRHVILDRDRQTVRYLRKGLEINLGGIGKGYSLDRAAEMIASEWNIHSALLHGGSSSVLALGAPPGRPKGWAISLKHPWNRSQSIGVVTLRNQGLGTSAATYQHFEYNGRKFGHLLDPRKGRPAEGLQQVSVIASSAAAADALSTAFFVMGLESTRRFCETHPEIGAVVLPNGDDAEPLTFNLTAGEFSLPAP